MLRLILIENDSYMLKNGKIHLLVPEGKREVWLEKFTATLTPEIKYLHGDTAIPHIRWSLPAQAARAGWVLTHYEHSPEGLTISCGKLADGENVVFGEGETLLIGELINPVEIITVSTQSAAAFRRIQENR